MTYFFESRESIAEGLGFPLFGISHLCWLAAFVLFAVFSSLVYRRANKSERIKLRRVFAVLLLLDEAVKVISLTANGLYFSEYLPFHLCSINIFLIAWHSIKPNRALDNFLFIVCIPAAMAALLTPSWTNLPQWNLMNLHSFTVHILLATYPIMLLTCGELNPQLRYLPGSLGLLAVFGVVALCVNLICGTNFMFLMEPIAGTPLMWFEEKLGTHLPGFPVLIFAIILVLYGGLYLYRFIAGRLS